MTLLRGRVGLVETPLTDQTPEHSTALGEAAVQQIATGASTHDLAPFRSKV